MLVSQGVDHNRLVCDAADAAAEERRGTAARQLRVLALSEADDKASVGPAAAAGSPTRSLQARQSSRQSSDLDARLREHVRERNVSAENLEEELRPACDTFLASIPCLDLAEADQFIASLLAGRGGAAAAAAPSPGGKSPPMSPNYVASPRMTVG